MFKKMSLLKTRFPGLLPNVVCIPTLALDAVPEVPRRPIREFFKSFFLGTKLGQALQVMSMSKAVPEGLKNQECEKGNRKKRPPMPYVPMVDEVQKAISKGKDFSY
jgi:hypothetical protein